MFRFPVENIGSTAIAIAIESGFIKSYAINQQVLGAAGDLQELAARGITLGLGEFPQQAELVRWMREYNLDPKHSRKIQFCGDISSFPREPDSPLQIALH